MDDPDSLLTLVLIAIIVLIVTRYDSRRANISSLEYKVYSCVNLERTRMGLSALELNDAMSDVARKHSRDMAHRSYFSHKNLTGESHSERLEGEDIHVEGVSAENIAKYSIVSSITQPDNIKSYRSLDELAKAVVSGWMHSTGHRKNIGNADFRNTGIGVSLGLDGETYYFTQVFTGG
ncbi:MAG: CAP domain-containing protein [Candidatus Altiarchaeota archaeon]|nr:CAP domain-containing protein [Candidatus Altiarchaeota archaeon]